MTAVDEELLEFLRAHEVCCVRDSHTFALHTALLGSPWLEERILSMREELLAVHWDAWSLNYAARNDLDTPRLHNEAMVDELLKAIVRLLQEGRRGLPEGPPRAPAAETGG